jgi:hypothetical protein
MRPVLSHAAIYASALLLPLRSATDTNFISPLLGMTTTNVIFAAPITISTLFLSLAPDLNPRDGFYGRSNEMRIFELTFFGVPIDSFSNNILPHQIVAFSLANLPFTLVPH